MRAPWRLALLALSWAQPAAAQLPPPPPPLAPGLESCVTNYGHTGCAARLYARLLCDTIGAPSSPEVLQNLEQQLDQQYQQAQIDFRGITPQQVETAAVRYYSPMLCPDKSSQIRQLFEPS